MESWFLNLLLCVSLIFLAMAFFQSEVQWKRRVGLWIIFGTIGLFIWFWTESWIWVGIGLFSWFAIPVLQAMLMSRQLRFSIKRSLKSGYLDQREFPELRELTSELERLGFNRDSDYWLKPSPVDQGFRIFKHSEKAIYAAIAIVRQGGMSLTYVMLVTPGQDKDLWMTWDYPLAYPLKMPPHFKIYRCVEAMSCEELVTQHESFISINEVETVVEEKGEKEGAVDGVEEEEGQEYEEEREVCQFFDRLFLQTIQYNVKIGLLKKVEEGGDEVNYSWRGTFFISWQVLREVVKG